MAYYYVKNGGTATGDDGRYATQQTGSFATLGAANYYSSIQDAIDNATTPPAVSDFINVSDLHNYNNGGSTILYTGTTPSPYFIVCVDDSNVDQGRSSGRGVEDAGGTAGASDVNLNNQFVSGMEFRVGDDVIFSGSNRLYDCKLVASANGDRTASSPSDGSIGVLIDCELAMNHEGVINNVTAGGVFNIFGGKVTTTSLGVTAFFSEGFVIGGGSVYVSGTDLTAITGTIIADVGGDAVSDDLINVKFDMCKLASGVAFTNETFKSYNQRALFTRCSDSSAAAEYQYHLHAFGGDVDDDSAIYRNEDEAFTESNQKISYKIVTNSDASLGSPLWLDFPVLRYSRLSAGATDTLRFYLTSNTALTDKDIYIELSYPDGTNKQTPNFISSAPTTVGGTLDLMATGTTLTTDSTSTWTGGLTNKYQIDVSTAGDAGADCQPIVKVYITKPSVTIQIASEFGLL